MDSRRATVRNMRSKCRCSCVLQFTFRRAVSCVLHRPPSQVIHCIVLYFQVVSVSRVRLGNNITRVCFTSQRGEAQRETGKTGEDPYGGRPPNWLSDGAPHPFSWPGNRGPGDLTSRRSGDPLRPEQAGSGRKVEHRSTPTRGLFSIYTDRSP